MLAGSYVRGVSAMSPRLAYLPTSLHCGVCRCLRCPQCGVAVPAMRYRCCPKAPSSPGSPRCGVCRYLRCLEFGEVESAMRQKFLPYCEPSPHCGVCRYLPCPQCRLVESTIVRVSRIADFESPQSRAIQDSAMRRGGVRNEAGVPSPAANQVRIVECEGTFVVCNVELRCP